MRVLIAEDDMISRRLLEASLKKKDYEVVVTCDGVEAWDALQKEDAPQLAILDWMMPGFDGVDVCRKLRAEKKEPYTYIILLTAKGSKEDIAAGLDAGADDYVTKPFNARELHARVQVGVRMVDLQNTLADHVKRLQELDKLKSDFLSTVSHELRTPIAVMRGGVSLILDGVAGEVNEAQKDLLGDTLENIDRLTRLITDLLDVSKIEAGKVTLRKRSVNLCKLVQKIQQGFTPQAEKQSVKIDVDAPDDEIKAFVDDDKITQIFNNLVSNAIRFTKEAGSVTIGVKDGGEFIECRVTDTGIGIAEKDVHKLFNKFQQIGRVEGDGYKGTGLGLVISKGLVEKHGGKIWVESILGEGTTFHFTLKKVPFPKILIVDDEEKIIEVVKRHLSVDDYQFMEAYNGVEALEKVNGEKPSLIVLDMMLPEMNGYDVICKLKENEETANIPILILSGASVDKDRIEQVEGCLNIPVMEKPIIGESLISSVQELVSV